MSDPLIERLRLLDPASRYPPADPDIRAVHDRALMDRITAHGPCAAPRGGHRYRRTAVGIAAAAVLAGSAVAVATVITTSTTPPSEPTLIAEAAEGLGIERSKIAGIVLGGDAQLRVPTPEGPWEVGAYDDTFVVKPPSQVAADGIQCPAPDEGALLRACLQGSGAEAFVAGRAAEAVARIEAVDDAAGSTRIVPFAGDVYLLPDPSSPVRLRAIGPDGAELAELIITSK